MDRGFFSILGKYTRNTLMFCGTFMVPSLVANVVAGNPLGGESSAILAFMLMFASLLIGVMYIGASEQTMEELEGRNQAAMMFGGMFALIGAFIAFVSLEWYRALAAIVLASGSSWAIWWVWVKSIVAKGDPYEDLSAEEVMRMNAMSEPAEEGVTLDFGEADESRVEQAVEQVHSE